MARFDLTDFEWPGFYPCCRTSRAASRGWMTGPCETGYSGGCGLARLGLIFRSATARTPPA